MQVKAAGTETGQPAPSRDKRPRSQENQAMLGIVEGQRFRKTGDPYFWVVEGLVASKDGRQHYAVLVREDEAASADVPLTELTDIELYQPAPPPPATA